MSTELQITSNARAILAQFKVMPEEIRAGLRSTLDNQNAHTLRDLSFNRMGHPSNGPVVPNGLRRISSKAVGSLRYTPAVNDGDGVSSTLGTNLRYVKAHEFGFVGEVPVRAHTRRMFTYGRARLVRFINPRTKERQTTMRRPRRVVKDAQGDREILVRAHTMRMNLPARHMIRDTLAARMPDYGAAISRSVEDTWKTVLSSPTARRLEELK